MKIIQVINSLTGGGAEVLALNLHRSYLAQGIDAYVISASASTKDIDLEGIGYISKGKLYNLKKFWYLFLALKKLKLTKQDIVHVHLFPVQLYISILVALRLIRCSLYTTEHNIFNRRRKSYFFRIIDWWMYRRYKRIICISEGVKHSLTRWVGDLKSIRVVYNGVELDSYREAYKQVLLDKKNDRSEFLILSVGSLTEQKNYLYIVDVLSKCMDLKWKWHIAGDGPYREEIESLVSQRNMSDRVVFLGFVDNIPIRMSEADLFLHLPKWEGFGLVVAEAMAAGCPVFASDVDGLNEILRVECEEGILVDCSKTSEVISKLHDVILGNYNLENYIINGKKRAENFSFSKMSETYNSLYASVE